MTGRSSSHGRETPKSLSFIVFGSTSAQLTGFEVNLGADGPDPTSVCINNRAANSNSCW